MSYISRGDATGMSAHDQSWRQLAIHGNLSSSRADSSADGADGADAADGADDDVEAFTPAFQFSAFRFIEVSYNQTGAAFQEPDLSSLTCFRIGTSFDWVGDVKVAAPAMARVPATRPAAPANPADVTLAAAPKTVAAAPPPPPTPPTTTAAERFNVVVAATRSTAISNYLFDIPTDCPHREAGRNPPLATKNLLEDTDGLRRPLRSIHQCPLDAVALCFC